MELSRLLGMSAVLDVIFFLISANQAQAYIDPGTGSYIIQLIIAGLVGTLFTVTVYWRRIKALFSRRSSNGPENGDDAE